MNLKSRILREKELLPIMIKGYSRSMANAWWNLRKRDINRFKGKYKVKTIKKWHQRGFLCSSIERYQCSDATYTNYFSDFDYLLIQPFNNSFSKWLDDRITTSRILKDYDAHFKHIYYSIVQRDGEQLILNHSNNQSGCTFSDILKAVQEKGELELVPSYWESTSKKYRLKYMNQELLVNGKPIGENAFFTIFNSLKANYVLTDIVTTRFSFNKSYQFFHSIKFWISNDYNEKPHILFSSITLNWENENDSSSQSETLKIDLSNGEFEFGEQIFQIPNWEELKDELCNISLSIMPISYYTVSIALQDDGSFQFLRFSSKPYLPGYNINEEFKKYLNSKVDRYYARPKPSCKSKCIYIKNVLDDKFIKKYCRKGIRPYMQKLWFKSILSDFLNTRDVSLSKKIWAWKRGFLSYRTYQYGLTKDNFRNFLSDYDYHYLNRINNIYQKWINDKTTTRFILDAFKQYVPDYYYLIFNRADQTEIYKMQDCPEYLGNKFEDIIQLLKEKKMLALKPSAGTHGDGFYCLNYENEIFYANGEAISEDNLLSLIQSFTSYYLLTEYIEMHSFLKNIYAKSVNTIRMMVINEKGYNPKIMQTYMRVGSSSTGYTDNVGYGGICVMIDKETGKLYQPETISNHRFYDCPVHPDTGTVFSGFLPNWDFITSEILRVSRYLSELEYLGFDVAITEDGFRILEINIHQDLHKVATFSQEMLDYFNRKINYKKKFFKVN